jgi:hypothetical protein
MSSLVPRSTAVVGGQIPFETYVTNTAPAGSSNLNYTLTQTFPNGSQVSVTDTLAPGAWAVWTNTFNTTGYAPCSPPTYVYPLVSTISDPNAANNPQSATNYITLDADAHPYVYVNGGYFDLTIPEPPLELVQAPESPQTAFGGTGGGETASASSPSMLGDPTEAAAPLNLDTVTNVGSPYITTDLAAFTNLPPDYDLNDPPATNDSHQFHILVSQNAPPGVYTNTFYFGFSDEQDLPGADTPGSIHGALTVIVTVQATVGIWLTNHSVVIGWFTNTVPGWHLEESPALNPTNWVYSTNQANAQVAGRGYEMTVSPTNASRFYRLTRDNQGTVGTSAVAPEPAGRPDAQKPPFP